MTRRVAGALLAAAGVLFAQPSITMYSQGVSPGSAPICLLLVSDQLPDDLLLSALAGPGSPLPPFALTLQL